MSAFFSNLFDRRELEQKVASIHQNKTLKSIAKKNDLDIVSVTWEDTARTKNSSAGPNISDMTLACSSASRSSNRFEQSSLRMPVIRHPNFNDKSADLAASNFSVTVGNESSDPNAKLTRLPFKDFVSNISLYTKKSTTSAAKSLWLERDNVILTSAQFCVLPLRDGTCEFNVELFNYQSYDEKDPAVLVIVASSQGTSTQIVHGNVNKLYINLHGKAANYVAERLEDDRKAKGKDTSVKTMDQEEQERNVLFIYQIPLKQKPRPKGIGMTTMFESSSYSICSLSPNGSDDVGPWEDALEVRSANITSSNGISKESYKSRGIDHAVLKAGSTHSDFQEIDVSKLERDDRFPIRCTLQFYQVTDDDKISDSQFQAMRAKIDQVYSRAVSALDVGSLVTSGITNRTTEPQPAHADVDPATRATAPLLSMFQ